MNTIPNNSKGWQKLLDDASFRGQGIDRLSKKKGVECKFYSADKSIEFTYMEKGSQVKKRIKLDDLHNAKPPSSIKRWAIKHRPFNTHNARMKKLADSIMNSSPNKGQPKGQLKKAPQPNKAPPTAKPVQSPKPAAKPNGVKAAKNEAPPSLEKKAEAVIQAIGEGYGLIKMVDVGGHISNQLSDLDNFRGRLPGARREEFLKTVDDLRKSGKLEKRDAQGKWRTVDKDKKKGKKEDTVSMSLTLISKRGTTRIFPGQRVGLIFDVRECRPAEHPYFTEDGYTNWRLWLRGKGVDEKLDPLVAKAKQKFENGEMNALTFEDFQQWVNVRTVADVEKLPPYLRKRYPVENLKQGHYAPYNEAFMHVKEPKAIGIPNETAFNDYLESSGFDTRTASIIERIKLEKKLKKDFPIVVINMNNGNKPPVHFDLEAQKAHLQNKENWEKVLASQLTYWGNELDEAPDRNQYEFKINGLSIKELGDAFGIDLAITPEWKKANLHGF